MSTAAQVRLLRVLQDGEFTRVGGNEVLKADVRIIAASNVNLDEAIETGKFRRDLFYRLSVFPIQLPPLRARPGHSLLVHTFSSITNFSGISNHHCDPISYDWP
jgi:transcriptional regulator with GAF, ATPase, and Fis domain